MEEHSETSKDVLGFKNFIVYCNSTGQIQKTFKFFQFWGQLLFYMKGNSNIWLLVFQKKIKRFAYSMNENNLLLWYYSQVSSINVDEIKNSSQGRLQLNFSQWGLISKSDHDIWASWLSRGLNCRTCNWQLSGLIWELKI